MKLIGIVVVAGLLLAGCYVALDDGVGSVGIEMPDASHTGGASDQTMARIYLLNETALVEIGEGTAYKIVELETVENEVSIGPVPSGPGYQVIVTLGNLDETTGIFVPERYALSESFAVIAGQATLVELESVESPFNYAPSMFGKNLVGITYVGGSFYTASNLGGVSSAFKLNTSLVETATAALPSGETAIGIDIGALNGIATVPWINTSRGILPYLGNSTFSVAELDFDADLPAGSVLPPVLDSGAFLAGPGNADVYGWFQTDGGLGGVYDEDLSAGAKQWLSDIDLSTFIAGQPVSDLAVDFSGGSVEGYFASKLGAFMLPEVVLTDPEINTVPEILDAASFFEVVINGEVAIISELAVLGNKLYLGTNRGVVSVLKADLDNDVIPYAGLVTESLGRNVKDMAIGVTYQAILTSHFLIVSANGGTSYSVIPIYAGIVTAPTEIFLDDLTGVVLISGETGLATVDIDDI